MTKTIAFSLIVVSLVLCGIGPAFADSIRDQPGYAPSSSLELGPLGTDYFGIAGYTLTSPFQINLEYQDGVTNESIDAINAYDPTGSWTANFSDYDEYVLTIDTDGDLPIYTYTGGSPGYTSVGGGLETQWTLTGWGQTILCGDVVDLGGTTLLRVLPTATYRPFDGDLMVNDVEVFDGNVLCEVVGYTFEGDVGDIGDGASLGVVLIPEPATLSLLALGGLALLFGKRK